VIEGKPYGVQFIGKLSQNETSATWLDSLSATHVTVHHNQARLRSFIAGVIAVSKYLHAVNCECMWFWQGPIAPQSGHRTEPRRSAPVRAINIHNESRVDTAPLYRHYPSINKRWHQNCI
jgi:hypothetical protein